jgi:site-specific recombinase XerC
MYHPASPRLCRTGVDELLGHESLDTLKHYAKLTILDLKKEHARCHLREKDGCSQSWMGVY